MIPTLLGGLAPRRFLDEYWQKKPLLIRNAVPGFTGPLGRDELLAMACRDDVESRFVRCDDWSLKHGPMTPGDFKLRKSPWTVLVQGVDLLVDEGDRLLRAFDFIPYARLDDLMASYATDGAGVGPHFDNYDVFLLQGTGQRRWRIGAQKDKSLKDGLPLKILRDFRPTQEFVLGPGDMLYLPPQYAHDGVAVGECTTWSIGFRAPPYGELGDAFLTHLQDRMSLGGRYADPGLALQKHPGEIGIDMVDRVAREMEKIRWTRATVADFLGRHLTEPKTGVYFEPPRNPLSQARFAAAAAKRGVRLDRRSQLLFCKKQFYINGETTEVSATVRASMQRLADRRELDAVDAMTVPLLYSWYHDGFLHLR